MIGGFIVRTVSELIACAVSIAMLQAPNSGAPNHGLLTDQNSGALYYPTQELVKVLVGLRRFADCVLSQRWSVMKPLEVCVQRSVQELMILPMLSCGNSDSDHRKVMLELIARKLIKPLFANYAQGKADTNREVSPEKVPVKKNLEIVGVRSPRSTRGALP
ncbi:hypothetical protein HPB49_007660 [Dermacentor silvarum]|uniref:Uncharacterized protein n=1 Tax=Dermacentor silvarum TaxID=543639 RepID=A0ACB8CDT3_DERSI|nr:hypothetical protein HPB49_007660 [Dermacentor silvarum]